MRISLCLASVIANAAEFDSDVDKEIDEYTEAIKLDSTNAKAYTSRGTAFAKKGDLDRAIKDHTEAIRLDPKSVYAYYGRTVAQRESVTLTPRSVTIPKSLNSSRKLREPTMVAVLPGQEKAISTMRSRITPNR